LGSHEPHYITTELKFVAKVVGATSSEGFLFEDYQEFAHCSCEPQAICGSCYFSGYRTSALSPVSYILPMFTDRVQWRLCALPMNTAVFMGRTRVVHNAALNITTTLHSSDPIELRFYAPLDTKYTSYSETFFPANLLTKYWRNQIRHNKSKQYTNKM